MGNKFMVPQAQAPHDIRSHVQRLPNFVLQGSLSERKFIKTLRCKRDDESVVVKVYFKQDTDNLRPIEEQLLDIASRFSMRDQPNVLPYQMCNRSPDLKAAFLVRQYFHGNLCDRMHTRPFFTHLEKLWIVFLLLRALQQMHGRGVCHGDIKAENVMLTSWNWVILTDLAPFKPTMLPEEDPSLFGYFFESSKRGYCYVAPERFYKEGATYLESLMDPNVSADELQRGMPENMGVGGISAKTRGRQKASLRPEMDIFSLGCLIAEIFLGTPLFSLPTLMDYRADKFQPEVVLRKLNNPELQGLILHMVSLDPNNRWSASKYLSHYVGDGPGKLFPSWFAGPMEKILLRDALFQCPDMRVASVCRSFPQILSCLGLPPDRPAERFFSERLKEFTFSWEASWRPVSDGLTYGPAVNDPNSAHALRRGSSYMQINESENKIGENDKDSNNDVAESDKEKADDDSKETNKPSLALQSKQSGLQQWSVCGSPARFGSGNIESGGVKQSDDNRGFCLPWEEWTSSIDEVEIKDDRGKTQEDSTEKETVLQTKDSDAVIIIISLLCACLRNVRLPQSKITALWLVIKLGMYTNDEVRLQRLVPFVVSLLPDPHSGLVRAATLRGLTHLLQMIRSFPRSDSDIFPEYLLPALSALPQDPEHAARLALADCLPRLATIARYFLEEAHAKRLELLSLQGRGETDTTEDDKNERDEANDIEKNRKDKHSERSIKKASKSSAMSLGLGVGGNDDATTGDNETQISVLAESFDESLFALRSQFMQLVTAMTGTDQRHTSLVKRALLRDVVRFCLFLGREQTESKLLPLLFTFLNDPDWQLRRELFQQLPAIFAYVPFSAFVSLQLDLLPSMLGDSEELVVAMVLDCVLSLAQLSPPLLTPRLQIELARSTAPLLVHPSDVLRRGALTIVGWVAQKLPVAEAHVRLLPAIAPFIKFEKLKCQLELNAEVLGAALQSPVSRHAYNNFLRKIMRPEVQDTYRWTDEGKSVSEQGEEENKRTESVSVDLLAPHLRRVSQAVSKYSYAHQNQNLQQEDYANVAERMGFPRQCLMVPSQYFASVMRHYQPAPLRENLYEYRHRKEGREDPDFEMNRLQHTYGVLTSVNSTSTGLVGGPGQSNSSVGGSAARSNVATRGDGGQNRNFQQATIVGMKLDNLSNSNTTNNDLQQQQKSATGYDSLLHWKRLQRRIDALEIPPMPPSLGALSTSHNLLFSRYSGDGRRFLDDLEKEPVGSWRPRGVLVHDLREHTGSVNSLCVSQDHLFFCTGSSDGTCKIWPTKGLTSNVLVKSRLTHRVAGRVTAMTICDNSRSVVCGSSDGALSIFRVDRLANQREANAGDNRQNMGQGQGAAGWRWQESAVQCDVVGSSQVEDKGAVSAISHFTSATRSVLAYAIQRSGLHGFDLRCGKEVFHMNVPPQLGWISSMTVGEDKCWIVGGTSRGYVCLWDTRFHMMVRLWRHSSHSLIHSVKSVAHMAGAAGYADEGAQQEIRPLVLIAAGKDEVAVWNMETGECRQRFVVLPPSAAGIKRQVSVPTLTEVPIVGRQEPRVTEALRDLSVSPASAMRGILCPPSLNTSTNRKSSSFLITGGDDRHIRFWDLQRASRSFTVSGLGSGQSEPCYGKQGAAYFCEERQLSMSTPTQERRGPVPPSQSHNDAVTDLALTDLPCKLLLSSSRDGVVKVWR